MFVTARRSGESIELELTGEWQLRELPALQSELASIDLTGARAVRLSAGELRALDVSSAWALRQFMERARQAGARCEFRGATPPQLELIEEALSVGRAAAGAEPTVTVEAPRQEVPVEALGRHVVHGLRETVSGLAFVGRIAATALHATSSLRRLRLRSVARHVYDTGISAVPIVALIAFLISVIIAYMSAQQLQKFGAEIFVVDLVTIGVLRELGVLLTAIIVAGRSGSAFAAEIGAMRLNEEVDALEATGVDPFETLVLPRLVGLAIALPLLTVIADLIGLAGGALLCKFLLGIPLPQYMIRVNESIASTTFWVGIIKAPVFAVLIGLAGTYRGLQVRDSSRELGRLTTVAVVQSIFLVILADALFAVLFMELDV